MHRTSRGTQIASVLLESMLLQEGEPLAVRMQLRQKSDQ
jgi:hypothetical protein